MPKGSKVDKIYKAVKKEEMAKGRSEKDAEEKAARIAQAKTGKSLKTGRKPRSKQ